MVVKGLEAFIRKEVPDALYLGNLKDLINQELQQGRGRPTIVLDASAAGALFSHCAVDGAWQPRIVKKAIENFVEKIISCGADLIVVLRGNRDDDTETWFYKAKTQFHETKKQLDSRMKGDVKNCQGSLVCSQCVTKTFASIKNDHYRVFMSVDYVHKEVAEIAIGLNCFAVIGQDSNYLIYEGIKHYVITKSININTLDCKIYNRKKLIEHLGLRSYHLPLFATLCGNDKIPGNKLNLNRFKFWYIPEQIRSFSADPYKHINNLVKLINEPGVHYDMIKSSLDMYLNFEKIVPENKWLVLANERKKMCKWCRPVYTVFTLKTFRCADDTTFNDSNGLLTVTMLRPLRQKMYGILFYEEDDPVVTEYCLEEMCDLSSFELITPKEVVALKPECEHPGLVQLYSGNPPDVDSVKWNLFCSSISTNLNCAMVRKIPPELIFPVLALHYLEMEVPRHFSQKIFNEKFEIEAFLVVAVLVNKDIGAAAVENYQYKLDTRVTSLIIKFIEVCFTLQMLNEACGLVISGEESCLCNYFDGVLLHYVYERMSEGAKWPEFLEDSVASDFSFSALLDLTLSQTRHLMEKLP